MGYLIALENQTHGTGLGVGKSHRWGPLCTKWVSASKEPITVASRATAESSKGHVSHLCTKTNWPAKKIFIKIWECPPSRVVIKH